MQQLTHIGLDVRKDTIAVAVLRPGTVEVDERVIPNTPEAIRRLLRHHDYTGTLRVCCEAGPTGYDTHRLVSSLGIACDVIAPSLIPRRSGSRADRASTFYVPQRPCGPQPCINGRRGSSPRTRSNRP